MTDKSSAMRHLYEIVSIQRTKSPPGAAGSDWHRYVIAQGTNTIHGYRQGSLDTVTTAVEENVAQLNERQFGKRGRVDLVPTPKNKTSN